MASLQEESCLMENAFYIKHATENNNPVYSFEIKPKWGSLPKWQVRGRHDL